MTLSTKQVDAVIGALLEGVRVRRAVLETTTASGIATLPAPLWVVRRPRDDEDRNGRRRSLWLPKRTT